MKNALIICGASGFVGSKLLPVAASRFQVYVLNRDLSLCLFDKNTNCFKKVSLSTLTKHEFKVLVQLAISKKSRLFKFWGAIYNTDDNVHLNKQLLVRLSGYVDKIVLLSSLRVSMLEFFRTYDIGFTDEYAEMKKAVEDLYRNSALSQSLQICIIRSPVIFGLGSQSVSEFARRLGRRGLPFVALEFEIGFRFVDAPLLIQYVLEQSMPSMTPGQHIVETVSPGVKSFSQVYYEECLKTGNRPITIRLPYRLWRPVARFIFSKSLYSRLMISFIGRPHYIG